MARAIRVQFPGACYHVINRGNYRRNLFDRDGAAAAFVRTLGEAATRFNWRIHAYVVMRNHFHLALQIAEPNLSKGMKWLQGTWVLRSNRYRRLIGRPFQSRFKALLVEPGYSLAQVCHYIHLNPLRAGVVTFETFSRFAHSSYRAFRSQERPSWLDDSTIRHATGIDDSPQGWTRYRHYLGVLSTDPVVQRELTTQRLSRGWCLGSPAFRKIAAAELQARLRSCTGTHFDGVEPNGVREAKEALWSHRLEEYAATADIDLSRLPSPKSAPEKVLLATAMRRSTSASNAWLCSRLRMGTPDALSVHIRRWQKAAPHLLQLEKLLGVGT